MVVAKAALRLRYSESSRLAFANVSRIVPCTSESSRSGVLPQLQSPNASIPRDEIGNRTARGTLAG